MESARLKSIVESLLLASGEPVAASKLAAACEDVALGEVKAALDDLQREYAAGRRGIVLQQVAGGYQLRTAIENAPYVRRLLAARQMRLSRPFLETLAIVAYRQPVTRAEIEELRGVDCGGVLETLLGRRLVRIAGRKAVPGRPLLYATTAEFLAAFGLKNLKALPRIEGLDAVGGQTLPEMIMEEPADSSGDAGETLSEQLDPEQLSAGKPAGADAPGAAGETSVVRPDASASAAESVPQPQLEAEFAPDGAGRAEHRPQPGDGVSSRGAAQR